MPWLDGKSLKSKVRIRKSLMEQSVDLNLTGPEFTRIANNFYNSQGLDSDTGRINTDSALFNYFITHANDAKKKYKVAFVCICLNPPYWQFAKQMLDGAQNFFLPGHEVDYFMWTDMPETKEEAKVQITNSVQGNLVNLSLENLATAHKEIEMVAENVEAIRKMPRMTVFPLGSIEWPMPTLMRYHNFLHQEETLAKYDYIFYCDVDMVFANVIGDEILGNGITAGVNPMYYLDKSLYPPYEPNPKSAAYIPRPGRIIDDPGSSSGKRFQPLYYAGGFQGGKADVWIEAMKVMRKMIDKDFGMNYVPIWNEESIFNRYLFDNPPSIVLNPSYIYPDSLIEEYYIPRWGRAYQPKLVTLTKKFTLKPLNAEEQKMLTAMQKK